MRFILPFLLSFLAAPAFAQCVGENLIAAMSDDERNRLNATVQQQPFPEGNLWHAQKGDSTIHIMGTMHLNDSRLTSYLQPLWPIIDSADLILLEGDRATMEQLKTEMMTNPSIMFITDGATLPERLTETEWQELSQQMSARGLPAFMVSKMRPWYVSMLLALPPCAMAGMKNPNGVDHRIINRATKHNIPTAALEPFDTIFSLFGGGDKDEELDMIRMALAGAQSGDAMIATMMESYLRGAHLEIWEFSRKYSVEKMDLPKEKSMEIFAEMEAKMLTDRNENWMGVILPAAAKNGNIVVAVGAAHLSGKQGVLNLLAQSGYELSRIQGF
ncbi:MAG TPA: TraB/GumN family protein [Rhodobacteraceae bacterium]|jgi:uncharacterized protein YbaP (TraB family)|nr:TraB/GumN family protein [Paracoccaceae bacterium]